MQWVGLELAHPLLHQRQALGEHLRLVAQARHGRGEVQQQHHDETERHEEEGVRRVDDAEGACQPLERVAPRRQAEDHDGGAQPQQRIALEEPAPPDEVEHDDEQQERGEDGNELEAIHQMP